MRRREGESGRKNRPLDGRSGFSKETTPSSAFLLFLLPLSFLRTRKSFSLPPLSLFFPGSPSAPPSTSRPFSNSLDAPPVQVLSVRPPSLDYSTSPDIPGPIQERNPTVSLISHAYEGQLSGRETQGERGSLWLTMIDSFADVSFSN